MQRPIGRSRYATQDHLATAFADLNLGNIDSVFVKLKGEGHDWAIVTFAEAKDAADALMYTAIEPTQSVTSSGATEDATTEAVARTPGVPWIVATIKPEKKVSLSEQGPTTYGRTAHKAGEKGWLSWLGRN